MTSACYRARQLEATYAKAPQSVANNLDAGLELRLHYLGRAREP
jgi:hypothetical protein